MSLTNLDLYQVLTDLGIDKQRAKAASTTPIEALAPLHAELTALRGDVQAELKVLRGDFHRMEEDFGRLRTEFHGIREDLGKMYDHMSELVLIQKGLKVGHRRTQWMLGALIVIASSAFVQSLFN